MKLSYVFHTRTGLTIGVGSLTICVQRYSFDQRLLIIFLAKMRKLQYHRAKSRVFFELWSTSLNSMLLSHFFSFAIVCVICVHVQSELNT